MSFRKVTSKNKDLPFRALLVEKESLSSAYADMHYTQIPDLHHHSVKKVTSILEFFPDTRYCSQTMSCSSSNKSEIPTTIRTSLGIKLVHMANLKSGGLQNTSGDKLKNVMVTCTGQARAREIIIFRERSSGVIFRNTPCDHQVNSPHETNNTGKPLCSRT